MTHDDPIFGTDDKQTTTGEAEFLVRFDDDSWICARVEEEKGTIQILLSDNTPSKGPVLRTPGSLERVFRMLDMAAHHAFGHRPPRMRVVGEESDAETDPAIDTFQF